MFPFGSLFVHKAEDGIFRISTAQRHTANLKQRSAQSWRSELGHMTGLCLKFSRLERRRIHSSESSQSALIRSPAYHGFPLSRFGCMNRPHCGILPAAVAAHDRFSLLGYSNVWDTPSFNLHPSNAAMRRRLTVCTFERFISCNASSVRLPPHCSLGMSRRIELWTRY